MPAHRKPPELRRKSILRARLTKPNMDFLARIVEIDKRRGDAESSVSKVANKCIEHVRLEFDAHERAISKPD